MTTSPSMLIVDWELLLVYPYRISSTHRNDMNGKVENGLSSCLLRFLWNTKIVWRFDIPVSVVLFVTTLLNTINLSTLQSKKSCRNFNKLDSFRRAHKQKLICTVAICPQRKPCDINKAVADISWVTDIRKVIKHKLCGVKLKRG